METIIIFLLVTCGIIFLYKLRPSSGRKDISESRQIPTDAQAEPGTDKLIRKLNEKEDEKYNAELKKRDQTINSDY